MENLSQQGVPLAGDPAALARWDEVVDAAWAAVHRTLDGFVQSLHEADRESGDALQGVVALAALQYAISKTWRKASLAEIREHVAFFYRQYEANGLRRQQEEERRSCAC